MSFINAGATDSQGSYFKSKKALREALRDNPDTVLFFTTALGRSERYTGSFIPAGATLNIVGPDPYNKRTWYASYTENGKFS